MNPNTLFDLSGKVAIITGGAKGIGKGCSEMLAAHGASIVVADFNLQAAQATAELIRQSGGKAIAVACDVTKDADLTGLVDATLAEFGKINILVNNVGGGGGRCEQHAAADVGELEGVAQQVHQRR